MSNIAAGLYRLRILFAAIVFLVALGTMALGTCRHLTYTHPLHAGAYDQAAASPLGERVIALYDRGLSNWKAVADEQNEAKSEALFEAAQTDFNAAYELLLETGGGSVSDEWKHLAADIQFTLGNMQVSLALANQDAELIQAALQNYKECLRLEPTNLAAKYNIELLQQSNEVNQKKNPAGPGKPGDKPAKPGEQPGTGSAGHNHGNGT